MTSVSRTGSERDVAISYASEDAALATELADRLESAGVSVFFDRFETAELWGKDLYVELHRRFSDTARYCIIIVSKHYAEKVWTKHELRSAFERALREDREYILPIRLDDVDLPELNKNLVHVDIRKTSIDEVVQYVLDKLKKGLNEKTAGDPDSKPSSPEPAFDIPIPQIKKRFSDRDRDRFLREAFDRIVDYFKAAAEKYNAEVEGVDIDIDTPDGRTVQCTLYQYGNQKNVCKVWLGAPLGSSAIHFAQGDHAVSSGNSINDTLTVEVDEEGPCLTSLMRDITVIQPDERMDPQAAAKYLWKRFTQYLN